MNKIYAIHKILNYITDHNQSNFRKISDGVFNGLEDFVSINDKEYNMRSYHSVFVDFNKKEIHWDAWEESGHNGSSYDSKCGIVSLDLLEESYSAFEKLASSYLKEEIIIYEEQLKMLALQKQAAEKLKQLLHDC